MSKEIYISSTPHETRLAIVENDALAEIYYERENEYTLAGSIYNGKVTRVLPGMQSSFVDIGLERDAFLYITDFMEEAGDSADFEASAGGNSEPRRRENRDGRGDRDRGGSRSDGQQQRQDQHRDQQQDRESRTAAEPSDADLFASAVSSLDPTRPVQDNDRGRRGGRDRNRGRHEGQRQEGQRQDFQRHDAPRPEEAAPILLTPPAAEDGEQVGEGAPGADGSRRWRGRRGRRGNRGATEQRPTEQRPAEQRSAEQRSAGQQEVSSAPAVPSETGPVADAYGPYDFAEPAIAASVDLDGVAAGDSAETNAQAGRPERTERNDRNGRNRRGRGNRGNRGGQDGRGQDRRGQEAPQSQIAAQDAEQNTSQEFASEASPYPAEEVHQTSFATSAEKDQFQPAVEPMILPGESLSKYRGDASPQTETAAATAAPVVDTFVASGWDGGLVLPGETIRPRGPVADSGRPEGNARREGRGDNNRGGNRERGGAGRDRDGRHREGRRDDRAGEPRAFAPATEEPSFQIAAAAEAAADHADSTPTYLTAPEEMPASHLVTPLNSTFVAPPPMPMASSDAAVEDFEPVVPRSLEAPVDQAETIAEPAAPEQEGEYEPEEGFASYRVDPAPPSEYRQSAPVIEEPAAAEESSSTIAPELETAAFGEDVSEPAEPQHAESFAASHELPQVEAPQFTSIDSSGEMFSEPAVAELPHTDQPQPAEPIAHEAAVFNAPHEPAGFAPGDGMLEEEEMEDEEDGEASPALASVHAHTQEHHTESDHEALEGVAELNVMLREMSIDNITRSEPATEEDDDYEEDFLEEDQDSSSDYIGDAGQDDVDEQGGEAFTGDDEAGELGEPGGVFEQAPGQEHGGEQAAATDEPRREGRGRRDGRRNDRNRRSGGGERSQSQASSSQGNGGSADRERTASSSSNNGGGGRRDHRGGGGRQSMQTTNLPAISDLLKPGQELLCQIAKEPIAKKGARITSHIALPGRFLVFMPTVNHTGVSRKIESDGERRRLKEILLSEKGEASGGFIVRTAAAGASEEELRSDLRFLLNLWTDIKTRSESSKSPALIYHDLNLVERVLRDQVTDNFSAIWVDTEQQYESVLRFLQRFQPSLIRRVKLYTKETPLFEQFGITEEINKALRSKVWLKSGGSIVINQTEALVAIDINTGKFVGKTARLEDTIVKTNLDAIPEIVRQIRLRDLGGIIIIDFIDMDERKNRNKVMAALEEELKSDRAPSKVLQFNDFGLVAITRKRVKQSLERTLSTTCGVCAGTGMTKSPVSVCNDIYVEMRKMQKHLDRGDVMLRVHPEVVKQLKAPATNWLHEMEEMLGKTILVKSDPSLHPEQFDIH